jgi:hypothetical protein
MTIDGNMARMKYAKPVVLPQGTGQQTGAHQTMLQLAVGGHHALGGKKRRKRKHHAKHKKHHLKVRVRGVGTRKRRKRRHHPVRKATTVAAAA